MRVTRHRLVVQGRALACDATRPTIDPRITAAARARRRALGDVAVRHEADAAHLRARRARDAGVRERAADTGRRGSATCGLDQLGAVLHQGQRAVGQRDERRQRRAVDLGVEEARHGRHRRRELSTIRLTATVDLPTPPLHELTPARRADAARRLGRLEPHGERGRAAAVETAADGRRRRAAARRRRQRRAVDAALRGSGVAGGACGVDGARTVASAKVDGGAASPSASMSSSRASAARRARRRGGGGGGADDVADPGRPALLTLLELLEEK